MRLSKNLLYILGLLTLLVFGLLGRFLITYFHGKQVIELLLGPYPIWQQALIGIAFGVISAALATLIVNAAFFKPVKLIFDGIFGGLDLKVLDIAYLSLCAGIGEELFFRGGLQPWLGVWLTALVFIVLHGYLNPKNWRMSVYGLAMVFVSAGLGYLYQFFGMLSAILAHSVFDFVLLYLFIRNERQTKELEAGTED